jgi:exodeoxyribonuclease VII large subunit
LAVLNVSELNRAVAASLERNFPLMRVRGEIAQFTKAASGHWYFSLRDQAASVRAVMFRGKSSLMDWAPKEGDQVEVAAVVTLYEPRGDFQLRVETMARAGQGALFEAFLARKEKLAKEGLLDPDRKRPLPEAIQTIGLVTSLAAAALRDVVVTLSNLAPRIQIRLYPAAVQGAEAPAALLQRLSEADLDPAVDAIVMVRGGGSMEDLWAFNDEALARAIASTQKTVVVGVGHETDTTLADLVADIRAATPTAAAQLIAQQDETLRDQLLALDRAQRQLITSRWTRAQQMLDLLGRALRSPRETWRIRQSRLAAAGLALGVAVGKSLERRKTKLAELAASLTALDPTAILQRGYALAVDASGQPVTNAQAVQSGDGLRLLLAKGLLDVRVEKTHPEGSAG